MDLKQLVMLALQVSIVATVFGFGLRATFQDLLYLLRRPGLLARSLLAMFVIMPVVAVTLDVLFELRRELEIVLVALALSPVPPLLPGREQNAGGHPPYALGLMTIVAVLSIFTVPLTTALLGRYFDRPFAMSPGAIATAVFVSAVLPLAAGLAFRTMLPAVAARIAKPVALVAKVMLTAGVLAILAGSLPAALPMIGKGTLLAMAGFVVIGLVVGHLLGGPDENHRVVLALSTASRHPAIALTVAKANFPDQPYLGATILLYLLVSVILGIPYQAWQSRRVKS